MRLEGAGEDISSLPGLFIFCPHTLFPNLFLAPPHRTPPPPVYLHPPAPHIRPCTHLSTFPILQWYPITQLPDTSCHVHRATPS